MSFDKALINSFTKLKCCDHESKVKSGLTFQRRLAMAPPKPFKASLHRACLL